MRLKTPEKLHDRPKINDTDYSTVFSQASTRNKYFCFLSTIILINCESLTKKEELIQTSSSFLNLPHVNYFKLPFYRRRVFWISIFYDSNWVGAY